MILLVLATMLVAGKLLGKAAARCALPPILGELVAGVLLGPTLLGIIPLAGQDGHALIRILAEIGVVLLLFEVGLETDLRAMLRTGSAALSVACVGVALPFIFGYAFWMLVPHPLQGDAPLATVAIFVGATLTATSVGITARVLSDLGQRDSPEARIILGAAVIDDVLGIVILAIVSSLAATGSAGSSAGSVLIIGAFAAGMLLRRAGHASRVERFARPAVAVLAPIFFVSVGAAADLRLLDPRGDSSGGVLLVAGGLTILAIVGKIAAGWAAPWTRIDRLLVGVGMVPRGEVGLIFADMCRRSGVFSEATFSAVLLMVMATTFIAPVALKLLSGRKGAP